MYIYFRKRPNPLRVDPLSAIFVKKKRGSSTKKFLRFGWKSLSKKLMGRRSSLHEHFVRVKNRMGLERFEVEKSRFWSCFKSAEHRVASSIWIAGHRFTRILCVSKLVWVNNVHKVEPTSGPIKNLSKSLMILKSPKTNLKFPFLIFKTPPLFLFYKIVGL